MARYGTSRADAYIGYIYLFFYGFEPRVFLDLRCPRSAATWP